MKDNFESELFDKNGNWLLNESYKEIHRLHQMLTEADIPHTMKRMMDGWQICYPIDTRAKRELSAIEHFGSYGKDEDLIEIMGLLTPEEEQEGYGVLGHLTAENVFQRVLDHYNNLEVKPKKSKSKYKKGDQISSISELIDQEMIFVHDKPTHRGWFMSWQLRFAKDMVERGVLFKAVKEQVE